LLAAALGCSGIQPATSSTTNGRADTADKIKAIQDALSQLTVRDYEAHRVDVAHANTVIPGDESGVADQFMLDMELREDDTRKRGLFFEQEEGGAFSLELEISEGRTLTLYLVTAHTAEPIDPGTEYTPEVYVAVFTTSGELIATGIDELDDGGIRWDKTADANLFSR
jgi:hypothetical protein